MDSGFAEFGRIDDFFCSVWYTKFAYGIQLLTCSTCVVDFDHSGQCILGTLVYCYTAYQDNCFTIPVFPMLLMYNQYANSQHTIMIFL